ncbi:hypothetical protein Egran_04729 [Elaphomyces granulatus]|uniref:Chitin-binding type-4 domain-containing protein n=1 Tax=Elaphomyces granulatus TaxID=519963 RepID=A0A232LTM2_9EURO|nr:hypothetical protein Egran_04729 [Elaphomyces granulatus]
MAFKSAVVMVAALLFSSMADAHIILFTPEPFDKAGLNTSPLVGDGSDFPCKLRPTVYDLPAGTDRSTINVMKIGDQQPLSFIGSAVHGGGSCQVSLTTDPKPSNDTKWQVIHSIMGGCPANVSGNLPDDPNGHGASTFNYSIPDGIAPGQYTLAWTWFNRVGNREMYMNCAPINVVAASKKRDAPSSDVPVTSISKRDFPSLFVANINGCMTKAYFDVRFPNPGTSVEFDGTPSNLQPAGQPACVDGPGPGTSGSSNGGDPGPTKTPTYTSNVGMTTVPTVAPSPPPSSSSGAPGVFVQYASPISNPPSPSTVASSPTTQPSSDSFSLTSGVLSGSCSPEGQWNCIGGTSFQRCASGTWSAAQPMAAGTTCTDNA